MDGMNAQRDKNTTNRREAAKLFNEHIKNQSDLGVSVTAEGLSDAWNSNSGGVMQRHAPTQERLKNIVEAQNKTLADKQSIAEIDAIDRSQKIRGFNKSSLEEFYQQNAGQVATSESIEAFRATLGENQMVLDDFDTYTGNGKNIPSMQSVYERGAQDKNTATVSGLVKLNVFDEAALQFAAPDMPIEQIRAIVAAAKKEVDYTDKIRDQADITFNQGVTLFDQKVVNFDNAQEDRITQLARTIVKEAQADQKFTLDVTQLEAAIEKAKQEVKRLLITNNQTDIKFGNSQQTFTQDFEAKVLAASELAKKIVNDDVDRVRRIASEDVAAEQQVKLYNQNQETIDIKRIEKARITITTSVNAGTATRETVAFDLSKWNITDDATIDRIWDESLAIMNEATNAEMIKVNTGNTQKRVDASFKTDKYITDLKKSTNENVGAFFGDHSQEVAAAIQIIANKYQLKPDAFLGAFSDWTRRKVEDDTFGEDADQTAIIAAMDAELKNPTDPKLMRFAAMKPATYSAQKQALLVQSLRVIGVDQYTPEIYTTKHVPDVQREIDTYLLQMDFAVTNGSPEEYQDAQVAIADLILETNADLTARGENFQQAFGKRTTWPEAQAAMKEMTQILEAAMDAAKHKPAPAQEKAEVLRPFAPDLYSKADNSYGDLTSIRQGQQVLTAHSDPLAELSGFGNMYDNQYLKDAEIKFPELVSQYEVLEKKIAAMNPDDTANYNAEDMRVSRAQLFRVADKIRALQNKVGDIMADLQQ